MTSSAPGDNPAAELVATAAAARPRMHGRHAADLLDRHGYADEAALVRDELRAQRGHLSAKQAAQLLRCQAAPAGSPQQNPTASDVPDQRR
ncbi:hypothetical protein ABT224_20030 [Streptomyces sp. NPDC001584]|uniref:hypothetical protein n=1 Tax=Streptomyces sp. NPDC001584 TaxID=3154521 RepID=UPI003327C943